jgi:hypothetical protein
MLFRVASSSQKVRLEISKLMYFIKWFSSKCYVTLNFGHLEWKNICLYCSETKVY